MKALLALLLAIGLGVGLAAAFVPDNAATVGGVGISQTTLNNDLSAIANSTDYSCFFKLTSKVSSLGAAGKAGTQTGGSGGYSIQFADAWLLDLIVEQLYDDAVASKGLHVSPLAIKLATTTVENGITQALSTASGACGGSASAVLASLPASFRQQLYASAANELVLILHGAGLSATAAGLQSFYQAHPDKFTGVCATVLEFATQTATAASAAATTAAGKIKAGTTAIATTVQAMQATTTNTTREAGQTCPTLQGRTLSSLESEVFDAAKGTVVGPLEVSASTGRKVYFVTEVTSNPVGSFSAAATLEVIDSEYATKVQKSVSAQFRSAVTVNPRYGAVTSKSFEPPASPPSTALLNGLVNTPGSAGSTASASASG